MGIVIARGVATPFRGRVVAGASVRLLLVVVAGSAVAIRADGADPIIPHGQHVGADVLVGLIWLAAASLVVLPAGRRVLAGRAGTRFWTRYARASSYRPGAIVTIFLFLMLFYCVLIGLKIGRGGDAGDVAFEGVLLAVVVALADLAWCRRWTGRPRAGRWIAVLAAYLAVAAVAAAVLAPLAHRRIVDHRACLRAADRVTCLRRG